MNQIVLAWSDECEAELKAMGFTKKEVYVNHVPGMTNEETKKRGERQLFNMKHKPYQFCVTSYWGVCPD